MDLQWSNLTVTSREKSAKKLLHAINGRVSGRFMAIMGPSGSGKTTLLNVLARRANNIKSEGETLLDGKVYTNSDLKQVSGYVMQDDLLSPHLTVEETLRYTAKLRLPAGVDETGREQRVTQCLDMVGLGHVRDVIVGDPSKKGISGGERKRLCVAIELLRSPKLLFLDEPTSGLDSVTALSLCGILKELTASQECTIVCTIHQPQAKIFNMFDELMLLCRGSLVYFGPAGQAMTQFALSGFPCPPFTNPADHLLDVLKENEQRLPFLVMASPAVENYQPGGYEDKGDGFLELARGSNDVEMSPPMSPMSPGSPMSPMSPSSPSRHPDTPFIVPLKNKSWGQKFVILLQRSFHEQVRNKWSILIQIVQTVLMAILIGTVFLKIGHGQSSAVRRQPVLFFCSVNQGMFGAMTVINLFPSERILMLRERAAGTYPVSAYLLARSMAETIMQIVVPIVFSCAVYFLVGLQNTAEKFFIFMGYMILCSLAATSMALLISAVCRTTALSVVVLPMALEVCRLFGGFFLSPKNLPNYFSWLDAMSYLKYSYVGVSLNELEGLVLTCTEKEMVKGACPIATGLQSKLNLGMDKYSHGGCVGGLLIIIFVCRVATYVCLRFIKW